MTQLISLWGVAPVAPIHLGYDALIVHQRGLKERGYKHILLLADVHAMMSHGFSWADTFARQNYYATYFNEICGLHADPVPGSSFQHRVSYTEDLYFLLSKLPYEAVRDTRSHSGPDQKAAWILYAAMQCLDLFHVAPEIDLVVAENSQAKVYRLLDSIRGISSGQIQRPLFQRRFETKAQFEYLPLSHDILGLPLSESSSKTRITIHESSLSLQRKIERMNAPERALEAGGRVNALLEHFRNSVFPWFKSVDVKTQSGGKTYRSYADFERDYLAGNIHPREGRDALFENLDERIREIKRGLEASITRWIDYSRLEGAT